MKTLVVVSSAVLLLAGCQKEEHPLVGYWEGATRMDVLLSVNGRDYRIADLEDDIAFNTYVLGAKFDKTKLKPDYAQKVRSRRISQFAFEAIFKGLVVEKAEADKAQVVEQAAQVVRETIAESYGRSGESFEQVSERVRTAGFGAQLDMRLRRETLIQSYFSETNQPGLHVSDEDASKYIALSKELAAKAQKTNEYARTLSRELFRRAKAGEDFGKLADMYSQAPGKGKGGALGDMYKDDFQSMQMEDVWNRLWELKVGDVLEPVNTDATGGWMIYKVVGHSEKNKLTGDPSLNLSCILLREIAKITIPDMDEAREKIHDLRRQALESKLAKSLVETSRIVFPHGAAFLPESTRRDLKKAFPKIQFNEK